MKTTLLSFIAALTLMIAPLQAAEYREGVHYKTLAREATAAPEIIEYFSFYCGACYQFSPFSEKLAERYPQAFKSYQIDSIAPRGMESVIVQSWATANVLGVATEFKRRLFHQHFVERKQSNSINDIKAIFQQVGVTPAKFEQAYASIPAIGLTNRMRTSVNEFKISSTPTYIVNGKYVVLQQGFQSSGNNFFADLEKLFEYLITKDHKA